jgi:hypothetical protein
MATLLNLSTGENVNLLAQHIFGRHPGASSTVLKDPNVSRMHASIYWDGECWLLQDSSTNGTFINGIRVQGDTRNQIKKDDKIHFANLSGEAWQVSDAQAPRSMLVPESGTNIFILLNDIAVLPDEESPEVTLFMSPSGQWICESETGLSTLVSGDLVGTQSCVWRFIEAKSVAQTVQIETISETGSSDIEMHFEVSQNEEHVALNVSLQGQKYDLGERNHHYLLLLLARQRLADNKAGFEESEQGWIEKERLGQMLGQSETHINIQVYRFRKQIIKVLPQSLLLAQVIERRSGQIRFVYDNIHISGGMTSNENSDSIEDSASKIAL